MAEEEEPVRASGERRSSAAEHNRLVREAARRKRNSSGGEGPGHASQRSGHLTIRKNTAGKMWVMASEEGAALPLRMVCVGNPGVGKTSLLRRIVYDDEVTFVDSYSPTPAPYFLVKELSVGGRDIVVQLWDAVDSSPRTSFFTNAQLVMLVFDLTDGGSFDALDAHFDRVLELGNYDPTVFPVIIVGMKSDEKQSKQVVADVDVEGWITSRRGDASNFVYTKVSAKTGHNVDVLFQEALEIARSSVEDSAQAPEEVADTELLAQAEQQAAESEVEFAAALAASEQRIVSLRTALDHEQRARREEELRKLEQERELKQAEAEELRKLQELEDTLDTALRQTAEANARIADEWDVLRRQLLMEQQQRGRLEALLQEAQENTLMARFWKSMVGRALGAVGGFFGAAAKPSPAESRRSSASPKAADAKGEGKEDEDDVEIDFKADAP
mmetsp:Transcript_9088/g.30991  ORF Transcript_9088/g.30991 Transcript_9088/m.30991 type:complete len:444 (+) Transcript_9088:46-1377(+)